MILAGLLVAIFLDIAGWGDIACRSVGDVFALLFELLSSKKKLKSVSVSMSCLKAEFESSELECYSGLLTYRSGSSSSFCFLALVLLGCCT